MVKTRVQETEKSVNTLQDVVSSANSRKTIRMWDKKQTNGQRWWTAKDDDLCKAVNSVVETIDNAQSGKHAQNWMYAKLYGNQDNFGLGAVVTGGLRTGSWQSAVDGGLTVNVIQSVVDAAGSRISKDQPKVSFVTNGADDYFLKIRATKLTKYMTGCFKEAKIYENCENVFRDACVFGTGYLKVFVEDDKIKTEWCSVGEVKVDNIDGAKQKPRSMHQVKLVARDSLMAMYPEHADKISMVQTSMPTLAGQQTVVDVIKIVESWHLPTTRKSKDGKHCITIENCTLFAEEYTKDYFPIIVFRWMNNSLGFWGRGISEEIKSLQLRINKLLWLIQKSQDLVSTPIILVPNEGEIAEDVLATNAIARLVPYSGGAAPTIFTPQAQNAEIYNHLDWLIQQSYQVVGLSQTSASGMKPSGVNSAVAIREVQDIESGRFVMVAKRWEQFFVDAARIITDLSRDLYKDNPELAVSITEKKLLKEIKWKDVDLEDNPFDIQTFPTSQLPDTPAGRIQTISEYIQNNWISKEKGMELLNLDPDLESEVNQQTSSLRVTEQWLSEMVEDGVRHDPSPLMNLALAQQVSLGIYNQLVFDKCPEDRLELVREFILKINEMLNPPPPPAPPGPPMGAPPGPEGMGLIPGLQPPPMAPPPQAPVAPPLMQTII